MDRAFIHMPIVSLDDAKAYIHALWHADLGYHFEDDAHDIIWDEAEVSPEECEALNERCGELYGFSWGEHVCPIGYALEAWNLRA
jgi:hypothetical protein